MNAKRGTRHVHTCERTGASSPILDAVAPDPNVPATVQARLAPAVGEVRKRDYWRTFKNVCGPYSGPPPARRRWHAPRPTAATGRSSWQRVQPLRGVGPFLPGHMDSACTCRTGRPLARGLAELDVRRCVPGAVGRLRTGSPFTASRRRREGGATATRATSTSTRSTRHGPGLEARRGDPRRQRRLCYSFAPARPPAGYRACHPSPGEESATASR